MCVDVRSVRFRQSRTRQSTHVTTARPSIPSASSGEAGVARTAFSLRNNVYSREASDRKSRVVFYYR